jgi:hypothetical protein
VAPSPKETGRVLELLAGIRRTQRSTADRLAGNWHRAAGFRSQCNSLFDAVLTLQSAIPSEPTTPQITGFLRDVKEFKDDVSALTGHIDKLAAMTGRVIDDMADIKTTLDVLQSRFEESAV